MIVGEPWIECRYYDAAVDMIEVIWNPDTLFRRLFSKLDLTAALELSCGRGRHAELLEAP